MIDGQNYLTTSYFICYFLRYFSLKHHLGATLAALTFLWELI
jgi:hypothetical protein